MTKLTAVQTASNCRWIRIDDRFINISRSTKPISPWRCVRPFEEPRNVIEEECASCEFWEPADDDEE